MREPVEENHHIVPAIGIDMGGTKVNGVVVGPLGEVIAETRIRHDGSGQAALDAAIAVILRLAAGDPGSRADRVGMAVAGLVDRGNDELVHGALLGLRDSRLGELVAARVQLPLIIENDANATLAGVLPDEVQPDSHEVTLLVALGTGVGGALSVGRSIIEGSRGFAGEFGHIPVEPPGSLQCPCGSNGCLELFASGTSVARIASETWGATPVTAEDVVAAAHAGDKGAIAVLTSAGHAIGSALTGLLSALDPATVYISGGFGHAAAEYLIPAITSRLSAQRSFADSKPAPRILADPVGPIAAALGAARLAQHRAAAVLPLIPTERYETP